MVINLTEEELENIISDAFKAGENYSYYYPDHEYPPGWYYVVQKMKEIKDDRK